MRSSTLMRLYGARYGPAFVISALAVWIAVWGRLHWRDLPATWSLAWVPQFGLELALRLDHLSFLFAVLITGVGSLVFLYSNAYMREKRNSGRFHAVLLAFALSMLGLVLSDNLLLLFVFWELTSITSFLLIGFDHRRKAARASALQALLITASGGLALLAGFVALGTAAGTYSFTGILAKSTELQGHPWFVPALLLILVGAFTKSAQFPFHFWLPAAMEAPSPVSAYLHSATMVKAGVYLLARFAPVFAGQELWYVLVCTTGALTMLVGAWNALGSSDLKQVLAHLTVSALGSFTLLCGIGTAAAIAALLVGVTAHALYKGSLFLIAGVIEHVTGTRDLQRLGGLRRGMPWTAAAAAMAAASLAGLPPLGGFVAKEALLDMALLAPRGAAPLAAATVIGAALSFAAALRVTYYPFFRRTAAQPAREPAGAMLWVPAVLAIAGPIMGLLPLGVHVGPPVALLSAVAVAGGAVCAWSFRHPSSWTAHPRVLPRVYERGLDALFRIASWQTRMLQRGSLPYYVATVCGAVFLLVGVAVWRSGTWSEIAVGQGVRLHEAALIGAGLLAAIAAARAPSYAPALLALSMVGIAVAALFALYGAPDLAMTQIAVDTMTVLLLFATLNRLPAFDRLSDRVHRRRHAALAATAGFLMTVLILVAAADPTTTPLARYFVESSHGLAGGRNVVNVILTDFRSLDTLGEVAVLAVAGLGVWSLLRLRPAGGE